MSISSPTDDAHHVPSQFGRRDGQNSSIGYDDVDCRAWRMTGSACRAQMRALSTVAQLGT
jgi:hypothetical protein